MKEMTKTEWLGLAIILAIACFFIFNNFLTMPRVGWDEGSNLLIPKYFAEFGKAQVQLSPGVFSADSHLATSLGWTVTFPTAVVFKIFGVSFLNARMVAAIYILLFLIATFFLARRWFGAKVVFVSILLLALFGPVYAHGKRVFGEVPSLFWLALGILAFEYFKDRKPTTQAILSGLCFGLYAAAKPTYIILFSPVVAVFILIYFFRKKTTFKWLTVFCVVYLLAILPTLWTAFIQGVLNSSFGEVFSFYFDNTRTVATCLSCNIKGNIINLFSMRSLVYMDLLILFAFLASFIYWRKNKKLPWFVWGAWLYGLLNFLYFLKGPGSFRHLFQIQAILVFVAPFVVLKVSVFFSNYMLRGKNLYRVGGWILVFGLILIHCFQIMVSGYSTPSDAPVRLEKFIENDLPKEGAVGAINAPEVSLIVPSGRLIHYKNYIHLGILEGQNPLTFPESSLLRFLIYDELNKKNEEDVEPYKDKLNKNYEQIAKFGGYIVLQRK